MVFTKRLREGVQRGEITCSVRFWMHPHVRVGARYPMGEGAIEIDSIEMIGPTKALLVMNVGLASTLGQHVISITDSSGQVLKGVITVTEPLGGGLFGTDTFDSNTFGGPAA